MKWFVAFVVVTAAVFSGLFLHDRYSEARLEHKIQNSFHSKEEVWATAIAKLEKIIEKPFDVRRFEEVDPTTIKPSVQQYRDGWTAAGEYRRKGEEAWNRFRLVYTPMKEFKSAIIADSDPALRAKYGDVSGDVYVYSE